MASQFPGTRWTLVLRAGEGSRAAMGALFEAYGYALYAFLRRRGNTAEEAQDLLQGFWETLVRRGDLARVDRERGRFRTFMLTALSHYVADEKDKAHAAKRGGGRPLLPIDFESGEARYVAEAPQWGPERLYDRAWALALLDRVHDALREEYRQQANVFEVLSPHLTGENTLRLADVAKRLGKTTSAVKTALHRMRARYGELLREEIAETLDGPDQVEDELRELIQFLGDA